MPSKGIAPTGEDILPRPGSVEYNFLLADGETRKRSLKRWKMVNRYFTVPLYRTYILPLFGFGRIFLLLYTRGIKTGKTRISPLEYHRIGGVIHVFSGRGEKAHWIINMKACPEEVKIKVGFRKYAVRLEIVENTAKKEDIFKWYVKKHPRAAKMLFGWEPKKDDPETTDFSRVAEFIVIVRLHRRH